MMDNVPELNIVPPGTAWLTSSSGSTWATTSGSRLGLVRGGGSRSMVSGSESEGKLTTETKEHIYSSQITHSKTH